MTTTKCLLVALLLAVYVSAKLPVEDFNLRDVDKYELAPPYYATTVKAPYYILPIVKWSLGLLEPFIDRATVENHYNGHHNAYRLKLNTALREWREENPDNSFANEPIIKILEDVQRIPQKHFTAIVNNGGGYVNHAFYWACLSPNLEENATAREPTGELLDEITAVFGSYQAFREEFTKEALNKFGSGYVWLVRKPHVEGRQLFITSSENQDSPVSVGEQPLLVIDVWEHAYYLKHQFRRAAHVEDWWMVVDWENVKELDDFWKNGMKLGEKYFRRQKSDVQEEEKKVEL